MPQYGKLLISKGSDESPRHCNYQHGSLPHGSIAKTIKHFFISTKSIKPLSYQKTGVQKHYDHKNKENILRKSL